MASDAYGRDCASSPAGRTLWKRCCASASTALPWKISSEPRTGCRNPPPGKVSFSSSSLVSPSREFRAGVSFPDHHPAPTRRGCVLRDWLERVYVVADAPRALLARTLEPGEVTGLPAGHVFHPKQRELPRCDSEIHGHPFPPARDRGAGAEPARPRAAYCRRAVRRAGSAGRTGDTRARRCIGCARNPRTSSSSATTFRSLRCACLSKPTGSRTGARRSRPRLARSKASTRARWTSAARTAASGEVGRRYEDMESRSWPRRAPANDQVRTTLEARPLGAQVRPAPAGGNLPSSGAGTNASTTPRAPSEPVRQGARCWKNRWQTLRAEIERARRAAGAGAANEALRRRVEREQALSAAREALDGPSGTSRNLRQQRMASEQKIGPLRDRQRRAAPEGARSAHRAGELRRAAAGRGADEQALSGHAGERGARGRAAGRDQSSYEEIAGLGAVNLAALEEFDAASERKGFLEARRATCTRRCDAGKTPSAHRRENA